VELSSAEELERIELSSLYNILKYFIQLSHLTYKCLELNKNADLLVRLGANCFFRFPKAVFYIDGQELSIGRIIYWAKRYYQ